MPPAPITRPASFDAELVRYLPGLTALARRKYPARGADIVQDTVVAALRGWRSYRPGASMYPWLAYMMGTVAYKTRPKYDVVPIGAMWDAPVPPPQEHAASIAMALADTPPRARTQILMRAAGYGLAEIGAAFGVSRQRVHQEILDERAALRRAANDADARWARHAA